MQYAFVTLALTAATLAMPTKRELLSGVDNVVNVGAVTSGLPVVSGLGLDVKRGIVDNTVSGTVGNVKDTVNGVKVGVEARDLVNGLVGGGVGGTVNDVIDTVGSLNVAKRAIVGNTLDDVKDVLHGVEVGAQVKRSVLDNVKDIVNDVNVDVATKRDVVNGLVATVDQTVGDLDVLKRDVVSGTVTPLLDSVTGTVDGLGLNVKRDSGDALGLDSGAVGSVLGSNSGNADKTLNLGSGTVGGLTNGLNLDNTVGNVLKRDSGDALGLDSGAVGSVLGSNSGNADKTLNLGSGTVGGLTNGLNLDHTVDSVVKRQESGSVLGLGSGAVGSVVGNSENADQTLNLGSGTVGGLTKGLNLDNTVGNVLKRQESGSVLGLGSGAVGSVVGNSENSDKTLDLASGTVGGLADGLNVNNVVEGVVKRQSGDVLGLASGTVGSVVGQSGNSDKTLNLGSGTVGGLADGLNVNKVVEGVVKRESGDVLGLASGAVGNVVGQSGNSDETLDLASGTVGGLADGLNVNNVVEGVVKRQSGDVLGLASGTVGGVVGGQGESSSVLDLNSGTVGGLMNGLSLDNVVGNVIKRSIQELDVHDLIASLSDEQIKQLTASLNN